jgi:hypothetical protein
MIRPESDESAGVELSRFCKIGCRHKEAQKAQEFSPAVEFAAGPRTVPVRSGLAGVKTLEFSGAVLLIGAFFALLCG